MSSVIMKSIQNKIQYILNEGKNSHVVSVRAAVNAIYSKNQKLNNVSLLSLMNSLI